MSNAHFNLFSHSLTACIDDLTDALETRAPHGDEDFAVVVPFTHDAFRFKKGDGYHAFQKDNRDTQSLNNAVRAISHELYARQELLAENQPAIYEDWNKMQHVEESVEDLLRTVGSHKPWALILAGMPIGSYDARTGTMLGSQKLLLEEEALHVGESARKKQHMFTHAWTLLDPVQQAPYEAALRGEKSNGHVTLPSNGSKEFFSSNGQGAAGGNGRLHYRGIANRGFAQEYIL